MLIQRFIKYTTLLTGMDLHDKSNFEEGEMYIKEGFKNQSCVN